MATELRNFLAASALALGIALPVLGGPAAAFDGTEKKEIETIVREYLLANPGILLEMQQALEDHQMTAQREQQKLTIENAKMEIFMSSKDPVLGNPDGEVTVVEFFDYNCGYCKRAMSDMITMMENDSELKFVLKEFPILGPDSEAAHRVAFAFNDLHPEKYAEFHLRLLGFDGRATEDVAMRIATELGADEAALRAEMNNPGITARIQDTYELANDLGINGTPAYVIGDEVVSGALGEKILTKKVANLRECGSTIC